ncbi:TetR/AcrR family transcriptional regulator [Geminicoccaceae bacterium 1502E]|nr:TetR/AcrR family transcriptional regulator [Geminicoccaceae bacterium 1502E]
MSDPKDHREERPTARSGAKESRGQARRQSQVRILEAAEAVFAARGYDGATTAEIARQAGLPKANVHYYFATKEAIYRAVIDRTLKLWLAAFEPLGAEDEPAEALSAYVRAKMRHSREHPLASRIFAREMLAGAPVVRDFLETELRSWVRAKSAVLRGWAARGLMDPVDPPQLFFMIWAVTQTYADFDAQICAVLDRPRQTENDFETATETVLKVLLDGCGVRRAAPAQAASTRVRAAS